MDFESNKKFIQIKGKKKRYEKIQSILTKSFFIILICSILLIEFSIYSFKFQFILLGIIPIVINIYLLNVIDNKLNEIKCIRIDIFDSLYEEYKKEYINNYINPEDIISKKLGFLENMQNRGFFE